MSKSKQDMQSVKPAPRVDLCENNPHTFLIELQRLIRLGYQLDFTQQFDFLPMCYVASVVMPDQETASV
jgi:hypothetical protein